MSNMEKIEQLFEEYRIALLVWNDSLRKLRLDKATPKQVLENYIEQKTAIQNLQDEIIKQSGDKRHFKRNGEI